MNKIIYVGVLALTMGLSMAAYAYQNCTTQHVAGSIAQGWCTTNSISGWANCMDDVPTDGYCIYGQTANSNNDSACAVKSNVLPYYQNEPITPYTPCPAGSNTNNFIGCKRITPKAGAAADVVVSSCK